MIWCLHGFLGQGSDWGFLADAMRTPGIDVIAPDLFKDRLDGSIEDWAARFAREVSERDGSAVLVGYSLGGRLALHALIAGPGLFRAAVIISAGLGIEDQKGRQERKEQDEAWASRFESGDWTLVTKAWNAQPLLDGPSVRRIASDFDRGSLAHALRTWSPARHEQIEPKLAAIQTPVLWVAGQRDAKYVAEARRAIDALPHGELWICPDSGHRVLSEQPALLIERLRPFLLKYS